MVVRRTQSPLAGRVAVVAGATRGAGRGIARGLAEAGALVYCTGRSVPGHPSPYGRPETIDETAEMIAAAGGRAVAVRLDHTVEADVEELFGRINREHGRLDVLVNSIAGEDPLLGGYGWFWTADVSKGEAAFRQSLLTHIITAKHAAKLMVPARRGLIVEVTENDVLSAGGNPIAQTVKFALKGLALNFAAQLFQHGVAAVAITPGYLRSESMLERFGVTEENWREHGKKDRNFLESETPLYVGRAVAALAADPDIMAHTGQLFSSWEVAGAFKLEDADGRRPDWGSHTIDFSRHPGALLDLLRDGAAIQLEWLRRLERRTKRFAKKLPAKKRGDKRRPAAQRAASDRVR